MRKILLLFLLPLQMAAQPGSFRPFKNYPFPTGLVASPAGNILAWTMNEEGRRNIYIAKGPSFTPQRLTDFPKDDGQEITGISISEDGGWLVFVRGGDHGANWDDDLPVNPAFDTAPFKVQVASIPMSGGPVKYLSEGDDPLISPDSKEVVFIKNGQAWSAPVDGTAPAKNLFTTRGKVSSLQWSPDGKRLLFVAGRNDHAIIGIYTKGSSALNWIAPSFSRDEAPHWSDDGSRIAFIRRPGAGGAPDSMLVNHPAPWSIYVADTATGKASLLWRSPATMRGSFPATDGGANLYWAADNRIVFLSYQDGWPHLYSIDAGGGKEILLTPGSFMCEHIHLSPDRRYLLFSANTGPDTHDIERRHAAMVSVSKPDMQVMTPGNGLEWAPIMTAEDHIMAFISATPQRPPLPAILHLNSRQDKSMQLLGVDRIPASFPQDQLVTPTPVTFKASDGVTVHATLFRPKSSAARTPAIVYVHGGPPRQMLLGWHYSDYYSNAYASNQYLASLGFTVFGVNYRLGIGYGYDFHRPARAGTAGAAEYKDIKAAGEWLRRQNFVDSGKIGIYGGSYGGYLTALALARDSKLFAAGVDFHGVHDWLLQSSNFTAARDNFEKAPDYELAVKTAWQSSPVSSIHTWKSPVLVIQGDDDRNVRFSQSVDLIRRLESKGIPYESLMIVDDTHHWMKFENAVTVYAAAAEFFLRKFMQ